MPLQPAPRLPQPSSRLPQPSFRRKPESMPAGSITDSLNRHSGHPNRHSGASRNLGPGAFGADPVRAASQPSFRRKPESMPAGSITDSLNRHTASPNRHSGASRNLCPGAFGADPVRAAPQPSFRRKPESMPAGPITGSPNRHTASPNRHSGASRNLCLPASSPPTPTAIPALPTVIPAKAGIYACRPHHRLPQPPSHLPQPLFWRKPESRACGHIHRHYRLPPPSFRHQPESMACGHIHRHSGAPAPYLGRPATIDIPASTFAIIMAWSI